MTQEYKELLLKDLCARLPYSVKVQFKTNSVIENKYKFIYNVNEEYEYIEKSNLTLDIIKMLTNNCIDEIKPYLFPLSSMTEEQKMFLKQQNWCIAISTSGTVETTIEGIDWLSKNHFDYRGLIEKDLALDATGLNIY